MKSPAAVCWLWVAASLLLGCDDPQQQPRRPTRAYHAPPPPPPQGKISSWPLSSELPLVVVDTSGQRIPDEPKISARFSLFRDSSGGNNRLDPSHLEFDGDIMIEVRGKTSQQFPKKQYGFKLQEAASLLQLPIAKDWILHGPYSDKSLMRNFLAYEFSNRLGRYAPRTRFVEVVLNDTGDAELQARHYAGVYLLMERIERGPDRVRIGYDTDPDDLSFIMKIDKSDAGDRRFRTAHHTRVIHVYPKGDPADAAAMRAEEFLAAFESALAGPDFEDPDRGYRRFIDEGSFVDYFIINELFKNIDAYRLSAYFHKDHGGKMQMGPVWDFNLSLGNADYYGGARTRGWLLDQVPQAEGYPIPFWWARLREGRRFRRMLADRWLSLRAGVLADANLLGVIEETAATLNEAQQRNFEKWPVLGRYVWPNPSPLARTYPEEIQRLKRWIVDRAAWMDKEMK